MLKQALWGWLSTAFPAFFLVTWSQRRGLCIGEVWFASRQKPLSYLRSRPFSKVPENESPGLIKLLFKSLLYQWEAKRIGSEWQTTVFFRHCKQVNKNSDICNLEHILSTTTLLALFSMLVDLHRNSIDNALNMLFRAQSFTCEELKAPMYAKRKMLLYIGLQGSLYYQTGTSMSCISVCKTGIFNKRCQFNLELKQRTQANIFQFIRPQAQSMEINSSDESCHHIVIPTLPFSEIKQTHATLCSTNVAPNASREFPRAHCEAASQWEPLHRRRMRNTRGVLP